VAYAVIPLELKAKQLFPVIMMINVNDWIEVDPWCLLLLIMIKFCIKHHFSQNIQLHPYLLANLKRRGLYPLKNFQIESFQTVKDNFNFFLNSCTGSGKTLSYLIPMINKILCKQDEKDENYPHGSVILTLNK
jgi:ATP-dependent helicase YprA (DUF1998 family)